MTKGSTDTNSNNMTDANSHLSYQAPMWCASLLNPAASPFSLAPQLAQVPNDRPFKDTHCKGQRTEPERATA